MTTTRSARVRAPELTGAGGWIGTGGKPLSLSDFRGRILILDFWTFCCVNCLHVLDELRPLEARFADVLDVVGVHSPKFAHEADHEALLAAVERYEVHHPVLDDPELTTWSQYAVRAWPTLCVVDPEGHLVHVASGEGHGEGLARLVEQLVEDHTAKGTLRRRGAAYGRRRDDAVDALCRHGLRELEAVTNPDIDAVGHAASATAATTARACSGGTAFPSPRTAS